MKFEIIKFCCSLINTLVHDPSSLISSLRNNWMTTVCQGFLNFEGSLLQPVMECYTINYSIGQMGTEGSIWNPMSSKRKTWTNCDIILHLNMNVVRQQFHRCGCVSVQCVTVLVCTTENISSYVFIVLIMRCYNIHNVLNEGAYVK